MANGRLSKLEWHKRTHGHPFTSVEFRVLMAIFDHSGSDGRRSHPGLELLSKETGYRRTGVSEAVRGLKAKGWIHETFRGSGKSGKASVFDLIPDAPNPRYRCPEEDAQRCRYCSNGSARAEPLTHSNGSARAEPLPPNGSGTAAPFSGETGSMVPPGRNPSDPLGSDPLATLGESPSDPVTASSGHDHRNSGSSVGVCDPNGSLENIGDSSAGALPLGRPDREGLPLGGSDETDPDSWAVPFPSGERVDTDDPSDPFSSAFVYRA